MKTFSFLTTALLGVSLLGGCHTAVRDPGPLAKACSQGNGHFECQVETVIRSLYDAYAEAGWHSQQPAKFTAGAGILTGILVNYRCGVPHSVETPYGTYLLNVGQITPSSHDTTEDNLFKLMPKKIRLVKLPMEYHWGFYSSDDAPAQVERCRKYRLTYYRAQRINGFDIPPVTYRPTPAPQPEE